MTDLKWTGREKTLSRKIFEAALDAELAETVATVKARAAAMVSPDDLWAMQAFLNAKQREIDKKYDYRYSQLILVFARLIREGRITEDQLQGLSEEKRASIRHAASWLADRA